MMNRIHSRATQSEQKKVSARGTAGAALQEPARAEGGCSLLAPLHYEPNYSYPLIVWLHAAGQTEQVVKRLMPQVSLRNYVAVAPRGSVAIRGGANVDDGRPGGFDWWQSEEHIYLAQLRIANAIEEASDRMNIHRRRVFLAGYGTGGTMALRVALAQPREFAGVLSLDGALPRGGAPLLRLLDARRLPVFVASGRRSSMYAPAAVCEDLRLLYAAGMSVTLKEYPGGDLCRPQVLTDVDHWIMETLAEQKEATVVAARRNG